VSNPAIRAENQENDKETSLGAVGPKVAGSTPPRWKTQRHRRIRLPVEAWLLDGRGGKQRAPPGQQNAAKSI